MRSVVVVLPASMWAMIPILRTLDRSVLMSTAMTISLTCQPPSARWRAGRLTTLVNGGWWLPAVVGEGPVGLGHLVRVLAALAGATETVGGVEDLVHQPIGHRLLATLAGKADQPAHGQRGGPGRLDLHRHLVRRPTDP